MRTSISYKLCSFRVGLWTRFWRSLWSRQNEIQPSVLLKLAHAASKRCRKSKSKGRITFCAPECFSWSTWHSAVGCVFRFVGSKFGKHHLHTTMKLFQDVPRIGSAKLLEDIVWKASQRAFWIPRSETRFDAVYGLCLAEYPAHRVHSLEATAEGICISYSWIAYWIKSQACKGKDVKYLATMASGLPNGR